MADKYVTVKPSGGDYPTLADAIAGEAADLTNAGYYLGGPGRCIIDCYNMEDSDAPVTVSGFTTSIDYYVLIRGAASDKTALNTGKWSTERYRLKPATNTSGIVVTNNFTRIEDIQVDLTVATNTVTMVGIQLNGTNERVERCILRCNSVTGTNTADYRGIGGGAGSGPHTHINCLVYDFYKAGEAARGYGWLNNQAITINVYNCTAQNCGRGFFHTAGTANWNNCGAAGCNTPFSGGTQTTCSSTTPTFVNEAGDDFHLAANDMTWKNAGTDYSGTFTTDIDGQTRPTGAGTWDIGCDEYMPTGPEAGSITPTVTL